MVDEVDRLVHEERLDDVVVQVHEIRRPDVLDVGEGARLEVVHADHAVTATEQFVAQVRPEESRATSDEAGGHSGVRIAAGARPVPP